MKKFIINITIVIVPFAIIVAMINYKYDIQNVFNKGVYEKKIASIILQGNNADNLKDCNDRLFLENVIFKLPVKRDIAIIGSSRTGEISSDFFGQNSLINCSVFDATINDYIAIIAMLDSAKRLPTNIFLDTSPLLLDVNESNRYTSIYSYYNYGVKLLHLNRPLFINKQNEFISKAKALFSFGDLQSNLTNKKLKTTEIKNIGLAEPQYIGRKFDCSSTYLASHIVNDTIKVMADIPIYAATRKKRFVFDTTTVAAYKNIIQYLKSKNCKVTLMNLPIQVDCYKLIYNDWANFKPTINQLLAIAAELRVPLIGTFDPAVANLNRSQFYDPLHCSKDALRAALKVVQYNPEATK